MVKVVVMSHFLELLLAAILEKEEKGVLGDNSEQAILLPEDTADQTS